MPWLSIIGIGEDGPDGLSPAARRCLDAAEFVFGGERHLAMLKDCPAERIAWAHPFAASKARLEGLKGRKVAVLASGDPSWFGAGVTLARWFDPAEITIFAHVGAFSLAAARLGWALQDTLCLSSHGRPQAALALHFQPGRKLLVLSTGADSPAAIARLLAEQGCGPSPMVVLEHLGGPEERRIEGQAATWSAEAADLNLVAITVIPAPGIRLHSHAPGLPDEAFLHDGQLTKQDIRAATLAALCPRPGETLWDVGAGCGSVAIEWMRLGGQAVAIESVPERVARIDMNARALGVPGLVLLEGRAPETLPEGRPDAIFVGGGASAPGLLDACWERLGAGGRLVANAVTAEGEAALLAFRAAKGGELVRLSVSRLAPTGGFSTWHPAMPVTRYAGWKP